MELLPGVRSHTTQTDRLKVHWLESGPEDGIPVVMVHGNLSTGRFFEHLRPQAPRALRFIAPDMRGFGRTERLDLDATRGLRDWSDDVHSLLVALGVDEPVHLVGWSTGGAAISNYATGSVDAVVADGSPWEVGTLGAAGILTGWPGADVVPPQPMVSQIREMLGRYAAAGGSVRTEIMEGSGHGPLFDAAKAWSAIFFGFLKGVAG